MNGWVKINRKMTDWEWYLDLKTKSLFLHLLLVCNHQDGKWQGVDIKRGQKVTSLEKLSKETGLSVRSIRTSLNKLKSTGEVTSETTSRYTLITLVNYDTYQSCENHADKQTTSEPTNKRQTNDKQTTTNKNNKNEEEDTNTPTKNKIPRIEIPLFSKGNYQSAFVRLTEPEIDRLVQRLERELNVIDGRPYLTKCVQKLDSYIDGKTGKAKKTCMERNHNLVIQDWVIDDIKQKHITDLKLENQKIWNMKNEKSLSQS
jgi:biotin operon repressor